MGPEKNADLLHGGNATYCGSCYGAGASDEECCNTCDEARGLVPSPATRSRMAIMSDCGQPPAARRAPQRLRSWAWRRTATSRGAARRAPQALPV